MRRIIIAITIVFFLSHAAFSQKHYDYPTIDAKLTSFYLSANWDSVIFYGNAGIADSIDYFYLREYLGEAYYYKQNYLSAIPYFENALAKNAKVTATSELLYYSYLFSGRESDARAFQLQMPAAALSDIKAKKKSYLESVSLESGTSLNNNFAKNQHNDFNGKLNDFGTVDMSGNVSYGHFGFKAFLGNKVSIYAGFTMMNEQKKTILDASVFQPTGRIINQRDTVYWKPFPMPPGNGVWMHDTIVLNHQAFGDSSLRYISDNTLKQSEIYINCNIHAAKGLDIIPFFHLLNTKLTMTIPVRQLVDFQAHDFVNVHTQYYFPPPPLSGMTDTVIHHDTTYTVQTSNYKFLQKDTSFVNFSLGVTLSKSIGHFTTSVFGNISNLNGRKQNQLGLSVTWFPLGNLNLYFNASLIRHQQDSTPNMVFGGLIGKKLSNKIWLEGNVTFGDMNNFTEKNGFVVNNNPDIIKLRAGITPMFIFKKFDIILNYQYQQKQASYFFRNGTGGIKEGTFNYQNHLITGGIKWKI